MNTLFLPVAQSTVPLTQADIDGRVFTLYDEYCHGRLTRRGFLDRAAALGLLAGALALLPNYARAQTISFTDPRIKASYVTYPSPSGSSGTMRGYLVQPTVQSANAGRTGPFPTVLVIHENRGLNPYIEDVARRAAAEGFLALAPDGLFPVGGYPGNDDDGRTLQAGLDQTKLRTDMLNSARFLQAHPLSTGKLGVTGFCWGGGTTNFLAAEMGDNMHAGAPFYGAATETAGVARIKAPLPCTTPKPTSASTPCGPPFRPHLKRRACRMKGTSIWERNTAFTTTRRRGFKKPLRSWLGSGRWRTFGSIWAEEWC